MDKNNDLEDELNNENLDFLEEEHDSSSIPSKNKSISNNLINNINFQIIKNLGTAILIIAIIGTVIFWLINKQSKNSIKNNPIVSNNLNKQNENPKLGTSIIESITSNPNNINNITEITEKSINNVNNSSNSNTNEVPQLQEIGQIKLPQSAKNFGANTNLVSSNANPQVTSNHDSSVSSNPNPQAASNPNSSVSSNPNPQATSNLNSSVSPNANPQISPINPIISSNATNISNKINAQDQNPNNNLSWQDIKHSIENNTPTIQKQANNSTVSTVEKTNTINVNGFERTANNMQVTQAQNNQANEDYKIQQEYIKELKSIISNVSKDLNNNIDQIKELQNNLIDISKFISNINNNVNNIDNRVLNLTKSLDTISGEVKNVKKYIQEEDLDLNVNLKSSEPDLFSNNPEYIIHAVIPGRAWLKNTAGQIITVAEGEQLGDYGKIAVIDANNNLVRTSSGVVFR